MPTSTMHARFTPHLPATIPVYHPNLAEPAGGGERPTPSQSFVKRLAVFTYMLPISAQSMPCAYNFSCNHEPRQGIS